MMNRLVVVLALLLAFGVVSNPAIAQSREELFHTNFSGEQLEKIFIGWDRVHRQYERHANLSSFLVGVASDGNTTVVDFMSLPTIVYNPDGSSVIHRDSRFYRVTIRGRDVRVARGRQD